MNDDLMWIKKPENGKEHIVLSSHTKLGCQIGARLAHKGRLQIEVLRGILKRGILRYQGGSQVGKLAPAQGCSSDPG